ncbi:MAG: alkaline phosphatase PhoX [Myxococcota bacterium]
MLLFVMIACSGSQAPPPAASLPESPARLRFEGIPLPTGDDVRSVQNTKVAHLGQRRIDIDFQPLVRAGQPFGETRIGTVRTAAGAPFEPARLGLPSEPEVCNAQDFVGLLEAHGHPWLISHFECIRGEVYASRLQQDAGTGSFATESTIRVDASAEGGLWNPCAGDITPWATHLGSEEYEPDARGWQRDGTLPKGPYDPYGSYTELLRAFASPADTSPYRYGWAPEIRLTNAQGDHQVTKHYAMGRFSHELSVVLPDARTVYQSDDGTNVGWFLFVADTAGDLSAGTLYAAQWKVEADEDQGGRGPVQWVSLGHATDAEIAGLIDAGVRFEDLFEAVEPTSPGVCPESFDAVRTPWRWECLKLAAPSERVPEPAKAASRLESRRYAGLRGATLEFRKGEGVTYNPDRKQIYVAMSEISKSMSVEAGVPEALDTLRLAPNPCGVVYGGALQGGVSDTDGTLIASDVIHGPPLTTGNRST